MAEEIKKATKAEKPTIDDKAAKDAAKATLLALSKIDTQKAAAIRAPSSVQAASESKEKAIKASPAVKAEPVKASDIKTEPAKAETKADTKKEADPSKEFVDSIMAEMALKGGSKRRLIKKLAEQFNFDRQRVMFKLKRALISERYAAAHEAAGH